MAIFQWMMDVPYIKWVTESCSIWAWPIVLVFHTVGLAMVVGTNAIIDLRVLGAGRKLPLPELRRLGRPMWLGFSISVVSGVILFMTDAVHKSHQTIFFVKLGLIAVSFGATILIRPVLVDENCAMECGIPNWARVLAATSLILWAAVIAAGRMMALT